MRIVGKVGKYRQVPFRSCIFCDGTVNSKEHLFPDWLRRALPGESGDFLDLLSTSTESAWRGSKGNGGVNSRKLRAVCHDCNGGWMSVLQIKTRPILERLAVGGEWWTFTTEERRQLAIWSTMTTMVVDASDPRSSAISQAERTAFRRRIGAMPGWHVWIGRRRHAATDRWFFHGGFSFAVGTPHNSQTTVLGLGRAVIQTFSGALDEPFDSMWAAQRMNLRVLWPGRDPFLEVPPPGWTVRRGAEACPAFFDMLRQDGPKHALFVHRASGVVFHDGR